MPATTEIRTQADLDRLYQSVVEDFRNTRWEKWMQATMRRLEAIHAVYWRRKAGPTGAPWPPNAPATIARKGHGIQLVDSVTLRPAMTMPYAEGAVRQTIDEWPGKATIVWGNDLFYSPINDAGTKRIPARQHIGITDQDFDAITKSAVDYAFEALKR